MPVIACFTEITQICVISDPTHDRLSGCPVLPQPDRVRARLLVSQKGNWDPSWRSACWRKRRNCLLVRLLLEVSDGTRTRDRLDHNHALAGARDPPQPALQTGKGGRTSMVTCGKQASIRDGFGSVWDPDRRVGSNRLRSASSRHSRVAARAMHGDPPQGALAPHFVAQLRHALLRGAHPGQLHSVTRKLTLEERFAGAQRDRTTVA
jgi:hypothetical protein